MAESEEKGLADLSVEIEKQGSELIALLEEAQTRAPDAFTERQEDHDNFVKILEKLKNDIAWAAKRVGTLTSAVPTVTEEGANRRLDKLATLRGEGKDDDDPEVKALLADLDALGIPYNARRSE